MRCNHIVFASSLIVAALAVTPASAKSRHHAAAAEPKSAKALNAFGSINDPWAVVINGHVVGRDPDPTIRSRILQQNSHSGP